jgi:uncharacterized protein with HEPN domain
MFDRELVSGILQQVLLAIDKVEWRFSAIKTVSDFTDTPEGSEKLDAICMTLSAIGESIKNVDKITNKQILNAFPDVDWKGIKGLRDIISHHYFDIDAEQIFWVCKNQLEPLKLTIRCILESLIKDVTEKNEQTSL